MTDDERGRRAFVRKGALTFLAVLVGPAALESCGGGHVDCTAGATADQQSARAAAHYLDDAHNTRRNCDICRYFTPVGANQCGPCSLNMGNVSPQGVCDRFEERA
jgi:hypothetical protein